MTRIRATRVPEGSPGRTGGFPAAVRYTANAYWPGITWGFDARCWGCTWAMLHGVYQVKAVSAMCAVHNGRRTS